MTAETSSEPLEPAIEAAVPAVVADIDAIGPDDPAAREMTQPAASLLPANHWAWTGEVDRYEFDPARAGR